MILPNHYDFGKYTDLELDEFLVAFPNHQYLPRVYRERECRLKLKDDKKAEERNAEIDRQNEARHRQNRRMQKAAIVIGALIAIGIAIWNHYANKQPANIEQSKTPLSHKAPLSPTAAPASPEMSAPKTTPTPLPTPPLSPTPAP
jgi:cytoskeletal protein RodZ